MEWNFVIYITGFEIFTGLISRSFLRVRVKQESETPKAIIN